MTDHAPSKGRASKNVGLYVYAQTLPGVKLYRNFIVREAIRTSLKLATSTQTIEFSSDAGPVINTEHGTIRDTPHRTSGELSRCDRQSASAVINPGAAATPMVMIGAVLSPNSAFQRSIPAEPSL